MPRRDLCELRMIRGAKTGSWRSTRSNRALHASEWFRSERRPSSQSWHLGHCGVAPCSAKISLVICQRPGVTGRRCTSGGSAPFGGTSTADGIRSVTLGLPRMLCVVWFSVGRAVTPFMVSSDTSSSRGRTDLACTAPVPESGHTTCSSDVDDRPSQIARVHLWSMIPPRVGT